jgi:methionyl-tRNA formyltransferase
VLVLTQPDRPSGRGLKLQPSAVKQFALEHALALAQPRSLRLDGKFPEDAHSARQAIEAAQADALVVAAYGLILPQWVLTQPRLGCFNIHASLLPRWRGAAPIHRAIEAGDASTGVCIMQMDAGLDTGCVLASEVIPILPTDTSASLHDRLAALGAGLLLQTLEVAAVGQLHPVPQALDGITYASKIEKSEASIDWSQSADVICRRVRAFNPAPGASTTLNGEVCKIWAAQAGDSNPASTDALKFGTLVAVTPTGIAVAAMNSVATITELQRPGGKRLAVADFLRGSHLQPGQVLG